MSDKYFTFPLRALRDAGQKSTPRACMELILDVAILNAGIGFRRKHGEEAFDERIEQIAAEKDLESFYEYSSEALIVVGAAVCGVSLGSYDGEYLGKTALNASRVRSEGALVSIKADFFWAAWESARWKDGIATDFPERMISWAEFRVLCALLSSPLSRSGYTTIGWESISSRACGFTSREEFDRCVSIPDHLAPPLTRKQIRKITDTLEELNFFARFRVATGSRGGRMVYSFRHTREELAQAVCADVNFRDRSKVANHREDDAVKCLQLLERAKSGANPRANSGAIPEQSEDNSGTTIGPSAGPIGGPR